MPHAMSEDNRKGFNWYFPPDLAGLLVLFYIMLPMGLLGEWLLPLTTSAKSRGNSALLWIGVALGAIGTALLFFARLPLRRQRNFVTFGPRELDDRHRRLYWWAYRCIGVSILLLVVLLMIVRG
jgi:hypothetical protein